MSQHKFEGELEGITPGQLEFIKNVIEEQGFKDSKVTIEAVGSAADNYGANVKRVIVEGENGSLSIIAKIAPSIEILRQTVDVHAMFKNEHLLYTELLPKMVQLQKQADTAEEDLLKFPKCYGTSLEEPNEVILIEDLRVSGFGMLDRFVSLSNECMTSVLRNLAIYHSLSYVLKNKEPDTYDYFKDNLADLLGAMNEGNFEKIGFFGQMEAVALLMLENPEHQKLLKGKVTEVIDRVNKMMKFENGSRYSVILHGDCWTNNIMFKFEEETLKQSMLIDYQQAKNFSPVYDLLYLIFNCTDHDTRIKHFYDWLDYYHSELDKSLSNHGLKANYVFPRDQLDADLKRYGKLAFGCSVLMCGTLTIRPEEAMQLKESLAGGNIGDLMATMGNLHSETMGLYRTRLLGLIESYTAFGLV